MRNIIKERLRNKQATVGSWMQIPDTHVAEIMGKAGFDWVALDLEHGSFGGKVLPDLCRALELGGTMPIARVAQCASKDIKEALESGCRGIIVPMIETDSQMREAVSWAKYPPGGTRGVGYSRANLYGKNFDAHISAAGDDLVVVAQIENAAAVRNLASILKVAGLDAIIVGPYDLSASLGITGQFDSPAFAGAMREIAAQADRHGIPMGVHIVQPDPLLLRSRIETGYRFIAYGIDGVFLWNAAVNPMARPC